MGKICNICSVPVSRPVYVPHKRKFGEITGGPSIIAELIVFIGRY